MSKRNGSPYTGFMSLIYSLHECIGMSSFIICQRIAYRNWVALLLIMLALPTIIELLLGEFEGCCEDVDTYMNTPQPPASGKT